MKLFGKKTLALALALTMVLSLCPLTAFAEGETTPGTGTGSGGTTPPSTETSNATAIDLNKKTLTLKAGSSEKLEATLTPSDSTDSVEWDSSDTKVATVDGNGNVAALKSGDTTITATVEGTELKATCTVTVTKADLTRVALKSGEAAISVPFGTSESNAVAELKKLVYTYTYGTGTNQETEDNAIDAWSCTDYKAKTTGNYTFTGDVGLGAKNPQVTVTVPGGAATNVSTATSVAVDNAPEMTGDKAVEKLPTTFTATVGGTTYNDLKVSDYYGAWEHPTATGVLKPAVYTYTAKPKSDAALTGLTNLSVTVRVNAKTVNNVSAKLIYDKNDQLNQNNVGTDVNSMDLRTRVLANLPAENDTIKYGNISFNDCTLGTVTGEKWSVSSWSGDSDTRTGTVSFTVTGSGSANTGLQYNGTVNLTAKRFTGDITASVTNTNSTTSFFETNVVSAMESYLTELGKSNTGYYVVFTDIGRDGGTLYTSSTSSEEAEEDRDYSRSDLKTMYYESNYDGEDFVLDYSVYDSSNTTNSNRVYSGTVTIKNPEILSVKVTITKDDTYTLSSEELQDALSDLDSDWTLDYITFTKLNENGGKLCYNYDSSKSLSKNTRASTGTKYFVEPVKTSDKSIDLLTYVPKETTSTRSYDADFSFTVHYTFTNSRGQEKKGDVDGLLTVSVQKPADITITAPANDAVILGSDIFESYIKDTSNLVSKNYKNYEIVYVTFENAPHSTTYGYLYDGYKSGLINGSRIKNPDGKKFAAQNIDDILSKNEESYDLDNTYFAPGSRNCTGGTFKVYGIPSGTDVTTKNKSKIKCIAEGYIDYVSGSASAVITGGPIKESNYLMMTPRAFTEKVDKNASYVMFTARPTGGKLVYNYNNKTPGVMKEISLNTPYYITYSASTANNYLGYVSFVPSYTSVKGVTSVIEIPCTVYNTSKKASACTVKISVVSATKSDKFTDVGVLYTAYADSIDFLYNCGITTGTSTTGSLYTPSGSVTRGEWITMLYRAAGSPKMSNKIPFTDVTATNSYSWCYDAVRWAYQNNICQGTGATTFSPAMKLDRQQIVTFMYNYAVKYNGGNGAGSSINGYTDSASVASWAKAPMEWAVKNQYYTVVGTRLQPTDSANRAEVALYMHRLLTY